MSTENVNPNPDEATTPDEVETEAASLAVDMGGNRMVPLSALIAAKRENKTHRDRVKELEPIAARTKEVEDRLQAASPIIAAVSGDKRLMAEALRIVNGATRPSSDRTEQPTEREDPDAADFAEIQGYYLADGQTPDVARARRGLDLLDWRNGRVVDDRMKPLASTVLGGRAEHNVRLALQQTDSDGAPLATRESIQEAVKLLGGESAALLANPQVVDHVVTVAMGLDRRFGRTPKAPDEPVYLDRQGGGRRPSEPVIDDALKRAFEKTGITEKEATASIGRLQHIGRQGVDLGK